MHKYLIFSTLLLNICCIWSSCSNDGYDQRHQVFGNMDSLLEVDPDSAHKKLLSLRQTVVSINKESVNQKYTMYLAEACNKVGKPLPSDSLLKEMVAYFEDGTSNEQMKSLYLLGCYYRDKGESPLSIEYYEQAVDCADTTDSNCDYLTLMRIYGQMAEVYNRQALPSKEIEADRQYSHYAMKIGNRYEYIRGIELQLNAYNQTGDTTKVLELTDSVNKLYKAAGMEKAAASTLAPAIFVKIKSGDLVSAKKLIDVYEKKSGLFDENGEIAKDRSLYYFVKGKYYLESGNRDSSELMFRKLGKYGHYINEYYGLVQLYKKYEDSDSLFKYSMLYDDEVVKYRENLHTASTSNVSSLYNYKRNEKLANARFTDKKKLTRLLLTIVPLLMLALLTVVIIYKKKKRRLEKKEKEQECEIDNTRREIKEKEKKITVANTLIAEKEQEIAKIRSERLQNSRNRINEREQNFLNCSTVTLFRELSEMKYGMHNTSPTQKDWELLEDAFKDWLPMFYSTIVVSDKLTSQEKQICMLCRIGIKTNEIRMMLNKNTSQTISNVKSRVKGKLFPDDKSKQLESILKDLQ